MLDQGVLLFIVDPSLWYNNIVLYARFPPPRLVQIAHLCYIKSLCQKGPFLPIRCDSFQWDMRKCVSAIDWNREPWPRKLKNIFKNSLKGRILIPHSVPRVVPLHTPILAASCIHTDKLLRWYLSSGCCRVQSVPAYNGFGGGVSTQYPCSPL